MVGEQLAETAAFRRSAIYADILQPAGIPWLLAGVAEKTADDLVHMSVFRDDRQGPFDDHERRAMATLLPAVRVATHSAMQLQHYRLRACALEDTFDSLRQAIFLVDADGRIVGANAAAEALLSAQPDLVTTQCQLTSGRGDNARRIAAMLQAVATPGDAPEPAVIHDEFGRPALLLTALPLRSAAEMCRRPPSGRPVAAIFAASAEPQPPAPAGLLSALYGLTPAEARLAEHLARGMPLSEIADEFGITRETARGQLKAIYRKTDTHRQSELVALALSLGPAPAEEVDSGEAPRPDSWTETP